MHPANERRRYIMKDVSHWLGAYLDWSLHSNLLLTSFQKNLPELDIVFYILEENWRRIDFGTAALMI